MTGPIGWSQLGTHLGDRAAGLLLADPVPSPSPTTQVPDDLEVTPGLAGFLATFAVAAACVLLFLSLTRHLRRARHNAEEQGLPVDERRSVGPRRRDPQAPGEEPGADPQGPRPGDDPPGGDAPGEADGSGPGGRG